MSVQQMTATTPAPRRRPRAFTLVELLVVVAIIALLVTILMPSLGRAMELARRAICATNLGTLGRGWLLYFQESNGRTPNMFNGRSTCSDCISQFNFLIWCRAGAGGPCWVNAGVLYGEKLIPSESAYVCPTIRRNNPNPWWHDVEGGWEHPNHLANPWPVINGQHTRMTYGTRRMKNYDDPAIAVEQGHDDPRDDDVMLWSCGTQSVTKPGDLGFMADNFHYGEKALLSHVPGVNVLYLDGHASYWQDTTEDGEVLYDNGLDGWGGAAYNWLHDDVWMVIDGHHSPPVGQGH